MLFGNVWQRSRQPLRVPLTQQLLLVQSPATKLEGTGYAEAEVALYEGEKRVMSLPLGKPVRVDSASGPLQVYVETSHRFIPSSSDADQYPDEYILHAWITQAAPQARPVK